MISHWIKLTRDSKSSFPTEPAVWKKVRGSASTTVPTVDLRGVKPIAGGVDFPSVMEFGTMMCRLYSNRKLWWIALALDSEDWPETTLIVSFLIKSSCLDVRRLLKRLGHMWRIDISYTQLLNRTVKVYPM
eukprot:scaffold694_cov180-Alexandrium_tamarense.AAC.18